MDPSSGCFALCRLCRTCCSFHHSRTVLGELEVGALYDVLGLAEVADPDYDVVWLLLVLLEDLLELARVGVDLFPVEH